MMPLSLPDREPAVAHLTPGEAAIAQSVLYAALFEYPLTLAQLRETLIGCRLTPTEILSTIRRSASLAAMVDCSDGYFVPAGRLDFIGVRRRREARSRAFLRRHRRLLHLVAALPFVKMVALSGSVAHLNLQQGGDLDLFLVTRGRHVWMTAVSTILLAKLLGRRQTLCANFIVADTAPTFEPRDLFTANQLIHLRPLIGETTFTDILRRNPFVAEFYPNFHPRAHDSLRLRPGRLARVAKATAEALLWAPAGVIEWGCRAAYRRYLRRRSSAWASPDQVTLGDDVLKLHTRSHRLSVLSRFDVAVRSSDAAAAPAETTGA